MPDYPRPCPKCGLFTERDGFALDRSKASGRKSHCKSCDRRKAHAYYDAHKDEMRLAREAARQAAYEADLERKAEESRAKVAAAKKLHRAQQHAQADYLRSIGVL